MTNFQVVIEGEGAVATATELKELLAEIGISGTLEIPEQEKRRDLGTIEGAILTFIVTAAANLTSSQIEEKIRQHKLSQHENQIERVNKQESEKTVLFIAPDGSRKRKNLSSDNKQDISEILEEIPKFLEDEDF
ncbi:hypothetical protein [Mastigocoleus testarum]|uniref:Uncharacterized protein n=1 Tax=Mastigocoleus testarum BC008 TaxID=371196 RepID=A0A0V7ZCB2_9CYAN|nr:hypothetical protein [Mastigocoleus testarum]KST62160.1 hypothetical protein BC008_37570 [Mastigocoleus testarum BC008]